MPIRPIDPAKRGIRPVTLPTPAPHADAERAPGHQPQATLQASSSNPRTIIIRRRGHGAPPAGTAEPSPSPEPMKRAHHVVDRTGPNWQDGDYLVGKGRPPRATQWQKGQSGNPRGPKPQEKLDPEAAFEREILADFTTRVNGEEIRLNMGTFAVQLLKAGAAKGTVKSQQMLLELFMATVRKSVSREDTPAVEAWEQQVIDQMLKEYGLPEKPVFRNTDRTLPEGEPS